MHLTFVAKCTLLAAAVAMLLSGCGSSDGKTSTQVAARVNKEEISVHQVNNILAKSGNIPQEQVKQASRQVLDKLIEQQLLVQQAQDKKLDRDANVVQAMEAARREILARAYLDQVGGAAVKPTPEDVREFYGKHPELFAERRIYSFNEVVAANRPNLVADLQAQLGKAKSLSDVAEWLKEKNVPFSANNSTKAAEQLPIEILPRLHQMKDGQIGVLPAGDRVAIMQLAGSRTQSLDEKAATPFIEQYLLNQRRVELIGKEVKQLREKASIQYMGSFAEADAGSKPELAAPSATTETAPQKDGGAPQHGTSAGQGLFDKGISGIR